MHSTLWIAAAIVIVIVIRRFSRRIASALGLAVSVLLAGWGYWVYRNSGGIALAGFPISEGLFYGFVGLWAALESFELVLSRKKRRSAAAADDDASGDDAGSDPEEPI